MTVQRMVHHSVYQCVQEPARSGAGLLSNTNLWAAQVAIMATSSTSPHPSLRHRATWWAETMPIWPLPYKYRAHVGNATATAHVHCGCNVLYAFI